MRFDLKKYTEKEVPVTPHIMKEIPFFKNEIIFNIIISFVAIIFVFSQIVGFSENGIFHGLLLFGGYMWVMYLIKFLFYMPRGDKVFVEKHYSDSGVRLEIMKLPKDGLIKFKEKDVPPVSIQRANKHFEVHTGKPFVKVMQGHAHNYSALELLGDKIDKTGAEVAAISSMSFDAGYHIASDNARKTIEWARRSESILPLVMLGGLGLIALLTFAQFGQLGEIAEVLSQIALKVGA